MDFRVLGLLRPKKTLKSLKSEDMGVDEQSDRSDACDLCPPQQLIAQLSLGRQLMCLLNFKYRQKLISLIVSSSNSCLNGVYGLGSSFLI